MSDADSNGAVEYRPIPAWRGYRAGDDGSVWSCWMKGAKSQTGSEWHRLKESVDCGKRSDCDTDRPPYHRVTLTNYRRRKTYKVHQLILIAFRGPCPPGHESRHLDGNHENNRLTNLEWATKVVNWNDKRRHGTAAIGERAGNATLTDEQVRDIIAAPRGYGTAPMLARRYSVSRAIIHNIRGGRTWKHIPRPSDA